MVSPIAPGQFLYYVPDIAGTVPTLTSAANVPSLVKGALRHLNGRQLQTQANVEGPDKKRGALFGLPDSSPDALAFQYAEADQTWAPCWASLDEISKPEGIPSQENADVLRFPGERNNDDPPDFWIGMWNAQQPSPQSLRLSSSLLSGSLKQPYVEDDAKRRWVVPVAYSGIVTRESNGRSATILTTLPHVSTYDRGVWKSRTDPKYVQYQRDIYLWGIYDYVYAGKNATIGTLAQWAVRSLAWNYCVSAHETSLLGIMGSRFSEEVANATLGFHDYAEATVDAGNEVPEPQKPPATFAG